MIDVKIDKFQGPLSLLLQIIEKEELDITSFSIAKIADNYLEYVKNSKEILPEAMADFLLMAAKLLYIKSKALLPYLLTDDDREEIDDLESKLKMYRDFVDLSSKVQKMIGRKKFSYSRPVNKSGRRLILGDSEFCPPKNVNLDILYTEFKKVLSKIDLWIEERLEEKTISSEVSIEEKIIFIKRSIANQIKINFSKFLQEAKCKTEVIVSFLAVLELAKQKEIIFMQDDLFGDIFLEACSESSF